MPRIMKGTFLVSVTLLCLTAFVQCGPLTQFIEEAGRFKRSFSYVNDQESGNRDHSYVPVYGGHQEGSKEADKITALPGQPINGVNFDQYAGYVIVDPMAGRALFYYFTESENSSSKPLVLWLNGGPGCSSIGAGAMMELGPFRVNPDGKTLWHNQYAWNDVANVLFLESPAGVGFSYSNTSSDYVTGDQQTAADSYTFLVNWLERFPEYKARDFFITGESYAGHYVPQLAQLILHNNKITNHTFINLKGIAVGNPDIDFETEYRGNFDYLWSHGLISDEIHDAIVSNCNFSSKATISATCREYMDQANAAKGHIYDNDIYASLCSSRSTVPLVSKFDPCSSRYVSSYLNTLEVQEALHANVTGTPGKWRLCNNFVSKNWKDAPDTVLPIIQELMTSGIRVWIYSGDTDSVVAITTTRYGIHKLRTSVKTPWYPWYAQGEVGGYVVEYQNLTFVTVRGSGHFVPSYQPARALALFSSFLDGKLPPSNQN